MDQYVPPKKRRYSASKSSVSIRMKRKLRQSDVDMKVKKLKHSSGKASPSINAEEELPQSALGNFCCLPNEMKFEIFNYMSLSKLGDMAMTSMLMHDYICAYIQTKPGLDKVFHEWKFEKCCHHEHCMSKRKAFEIATFFKKLILFWPCRTKINFIANVILKSKCLWREECLKPNIFFGAFIQFVTANWTQPEKWIAHEILDTRSKMLNMLEKVLASRVGLMDKEERMVRDYYRGVYCTIVGREFDAAWFYCILKLQPYCYQAKILLLLFAPTNAEGAIEWRVFSGVTNQSPERQFVINKAIHDLAGVLHDLRNSNNICLDGIMTLLDEIIAFPVPWHQRNICQFILCTGGDLLQYVLRGYLLDGRFEEFSSFVMICSTLHICEMQAEIFSELVVRTVDYDDQLPTILSAFLDYFYNFCREHRAMLSGNRVMQAVLRAFHRRFPIRRSKRLALKHAKSCPNEHLH